MEVVTKQITFKREIKIKIRAVTYIVAAHFDDSRDSLKVKINHLLSAEIDRSVSE